MRDEFREDFDSGRGGWGHMKAREMQMQMEEERERAQRDVYLGDHQALEGGQFRAVPIGDHVISDTFEDGARENPRFRTEREEEEEYM